MKKITEIVQKIESPYVGEDCIQIMMPYQNEITVLGSNGILFQHQPNESIYINKYLEDERRKQFPYCNIPIHYTKDVFRKNRVCYSNQLLDYEKPYIRIGDGIVYETFVVKDNNQALLINKLSYEDGQRKQIRHMNYNELLKFINKQDTKEQIYYVYLDGSVQSESRFYSNEEIINDFIKEVFKINIKNLRKYQQNHSDVVSNHLKFNPWILNYIEQSINNLDMSLIDFNIGFSSDYSPFLLIRIANGNISIQSIDITFVRQDNFKVEIFDIPVNKYTLEQLKFMPKINISKEPRIPLKLNPGVTKQDIREAKQMVRELRK